MERTKETLEARVRETPLVDRLKECQQRIGNMCAELRGPKMSIPVEYYDDDFYICTTLADAQATVEALQVHQQLHDRIFERQKCLLAHYVTTIRDAVRRLRNSTHSAEQPEPYESRTPVIAAFLEEALGVNAEEVEKERTNLKQQVEALQRERDALEAKCLEEHVTIEQADAKVMKLEGEKGMWANERIDLLTQLENAEFALDAEREKVKGLHEITKVICTHCCEPMEIPSKAVLQTQLTQLQALVRALPAPEEGGFPIVEVDGDYYVNHTSRFSTKAEADAYTGLLTYRATLDATTPAQTDEQRCIEACCERPHDCKWGGTGGCGYEGRKPKGGDGE